MNLKDMRNTVVTFSSPGEPGQVLQVEIQGIPSLAAWTVLVRLHLRPVNPSDLMTIRGNYGHQPKSFPATPGYEGVGVIEAVGLGLAPLKRFLLGRRVIVVNNSNLPQAGTWQDYLVTPLWEGVLPVPASLTDEQAAMLIVNPGAAMVMVRNVLKVPQGEWLLQTAAGSALGKIVIQLGRAYGFRTINVIRNAEQAQELKQLGGDVVIVAGQDLKQEVLAQTRGKGFRYALDAVGGELGNAVIDALAPRGHLLIIGDLGEGNLKLDVKKILFKTLRIEGFWLSEWVRRNPFKIPGLYFRLVRLLSSQKLVMPECRTFPLEEVVAAVEFAESPLKGSKVLLESRT